MTAPQVTLVASSPSISVAGRFMHVVKEKRHDERGPMPIEDDMWLGMRAIELRGVTIGWGYVVSAGFVVTRDVALYSVVADTTAREVRVPFNAGQIERHERRLYGGVLTVPASLSGPTPDAR